MIRDMQYCHRGRIVEGGLTDDLKYLGFSLRTCFGKACCSHSLKGNNARRKVEPMMESLDLHRDDTAPATKASATFFKFQEGLSYNIAVGFVSHRLRLKRSYGNVIMR